MCVGTAVEVFSDEGVVAWYDARTVLVGGQHSIFAVVYLRASDGEVFGDRCSCQVGDIGGLQDGTFVGNDTAHVQPHKVAVLQARNGDGRTAVQTDVRIGCCAVVIDIERFLGGFYHQTSSLFYDKGIVALCQPAVGPSWLLLAIAIYFFPRGVGSPMVATRTCIARPCYRVIRNGLCVLVRTLIVAYLVVMGCLELQTRTAVEVPLLA